MNPQKSAHLSWVREPIRKSIAQCKQAMIDLTAKRDRLNNPPSGAEHIWFANQRESLEKSHAVIDGCLTGIEAALEVIQCAGGHVLAKEIKTLATVALEFESVDDQDRALLTIQDSLEILPSFLGMVIEGAHDAPGVLLKYINELRALRNVTALSDESAMPINLSFAYKSPPLYEADCDLAERERVFNNASANFCKLYSMAMKSKTEAPWAEMLTHLRELQRVTNDPELGSYWWVGEAIVDVIIADGLYLPPAMNTALRVVMVATQRIPKGEEHAKENLNPGKFSALLNSLSISRKQTPVSGDVISHFDVKQNVEEDRIERLQAMLDAQSVQSIVDVMPEIRPRLEAAMVSFGRALAARSDEGFQVQTQAFDRAIRTIANVFGIFNESELSDVCFSLADMVKGVEKASDFHSEAVETVKGQILFLDARLTHLDRNPAADLLQIQNVTSDVVQVIAEVAYAELVKVSGLIATHVDSGVGSEKLLIALSSLHELSQVFQFAGSKTIGGVLAAVVTKTTECVEGGVLSEFAGLSNCAKAMVSIELYLQYINAGLQPPLDLIERAVEALRDLGLDTSKIEIISKLDLSAKFNESSNANDAEIDPLLQEIFELRPTIQELHKKFSLDETTKLNNFSKTCLRLGAAGMVKGEKQFAELCKYAGEIAKGATGRADDDAYDGKLSLNLLSRSSELILRCLDEYSSKGAIKIFMVDFTESLKSFLGHEDSEHNSRELKESLPVAPSRPLPDNYDPVLQGLYDQEFAEQIELLREFLEGDNLQINSQVCRAVHTIHGCSASAGCEVIAALFEVLEARFYAIKACDDSLTFEQVEDLKDLLTEVETYQANFPWEVESLLLPAWIEIAATMVGSQVSAEVEDDGEHELEPFTESEPQTDLDSLSPEGGGLGPMPIVETHLPALESRDAVSISTPHEEPVPEYDVSDVELYLLDSDEVIPELQQNISAWMDNKADSDLAASIRRNMHTLKGAASIIRAQGIASLTHNMESLFQAIAVGNIEATKPCADLVNFVIDEIITLSDAVRRQKAYSVNAALNDFVAECCDVFRVDGDKFIQIAQASYGPKKANSIEPEPQPALDAHQANTVDIGDSVSSPSLAPQQATGEEAACTRIEPELVSDTDTSQKSMPEDVSLEVEPEVSAPELSPQLDGSETDVGGSDSELKAKGTRRGYRGMRKRAVGERQNNYLQKQERKSATGSVAETKQVGDEAFAELDVEGITPQDLRACQSVEDLLKLAAPGKDDWVSKKKSGTPAKIRVDLALLDDSVKQANELKASLYRQSTLYREMMLSILALREKLSLHLMHHNKATVQLRDFNNIKFSAGYLGNSSLSEDQQRLNLERFNHLSVSNTQAGVQIEQLLQDSQDIIAQSHLMQSTFEHQTGVVTRLQRDLLKSRLVSFQNEKQTFNAALTAAKQYSQTKVELDFRNSDTLVDRQLLESIREALRHIVNNCVAHGIESEEERVKLGKNPVGKVIVGAKRGARSLVFSIEDDGRGIDPQIIRRKALALGLINPEDELNDEKLIYLITAAGFTTSTELSELSGRGVGMDCVREKVSTYGGQLRIHSEVGKGSRFELEFPVTMGSNRAVVCSVSDQWFAIPTFNMVQVMDYPTGDLIKRKAKAGNATVEFEDKAYEVVHLADLIAIPDLKVSSSHNQSHTSLILVEQNNIRMAIEVEKGITMPEIHVTKFEGVLSGVSGIIGSTEIHDGTPAIVLDVIELARLNLKSTSEGYKPRIYRIRRVRSSAKKRVFIVDDSNSYRRLITNHFETLGWEVAVARDGQDALDKLPTIGEIHLFVVDVEMPRIDGLVLTERLRAKEVLDDIPIIMLTTRSNLKEQALALGVNAFLSKPYDEVALNETIKQVCPELLDAEVGV